MHFFARLKSGWGLSFTILALIAGSTLIFAGCLGIGESDSSPTNSPSGKNATFKVTNHTGTRIQFDITQGAETLPGMADREVGNGSTGTYQVQFESTLQIIYSVWETHYITDLFTGDTLSVSSSWSGRRHHLYLGTPNNGQTIYLTATEH